MFIGIASANQYRCGDNFNSYNNNKITTENKIVFVTSVIVTTTIRVAAALGLSTKNLLG